MSLDENDYYEFLVFSNMVGATSDTNSNAKNYQSKNHKDYGTSSGKLGTDTGNLKYKKKLIREVANAVDFGTCLYTG